MGLNHLIKKELVELVKVIKELQEDIKVVKLMDHNQEIFHLKYQIKKKSKQ